MEIPHLLLLLSFSPLLTSKWSLVQLDSKDGREASGSADFDQDGHEVGHRAMVLTNVTFNHNNIVIAGKVAHIPKERQNSWLFEARPKYPDQRKGDVQEKGRTP